MIWAEVVGSVVKRSGESAVRADGHKLIRSTLSNERSDLLFDLRTDPGERVNVVQSRPDVAKQLETASEPLLRMRVAPRSAGATPAAPDPAIRERLRALGYTD